jgi:hypothetical protein
MARSRIAEAYVQIVPTMDGVSSKLKTQLSGELDQAGKAGGETMAKGVGTGFGSKIKSFIGPAIIAAGTFAVTNFVKGAIAAGENAATSNARIQQIAESMGLFGDETDTVTKRLIDLANAQARSTGFDQNAIKETQAKLLTFKELAGTADEVGGNFDRATAAAIDLAAAGFGSAETNAVQLGKALQDPIRGIAALGRSGVTFTEQEREKIKALVESGDILAAQEIVLKAVETQVGGTAEATANSTDKMRNAFAQLQERIGLALAPAFEALTNFLIDQFIPAVEFIFNFFKDNFAVIATFVGVLGGLTLALNAVRIATTIWTTAQALLNAVLALNPIVLVVIAVAALTAGIVFLATRTTFFQDTWRAMTKAVTDAWQSFKLMFESVVKAVIGFFKLLVDNLKTAWETAVKDIKTGLDFIKTTFESVFNAITGFFKGVINGWIGMVEGFVNGFIRGINNIIRAFNAIKFDVPDWVPVIGGKSFGFNLSQISEIRLPRLAKGGFVDQPTTALIGEAGPEVVMPLKDFERMMGLDSGPRASINYYAAPNQSLDAEQALLQAMRRAKVVAAW